jgi:hypothetical protein
MEKTANCGFITSPKVIVMINSTPCGTKIGDTKIVKKLVCDAWEDNIWETHE